MLLPVLASCIALGGLDFERDVRPILADACFRCHGPDGGARKAGLRLDLREGLFGSIREPAAIAHVVEPAHPEASELWRRISSHADDERMPPPSTLRPLTPAEIERLRQWIEQGAPWTGHWAFQPLRSDALPEPRGVASCRNEIDRFVLAALEAQGLSPDAAQSQILASAFNRTHPTKGEGGRGVGGSRIDWVPDRVDTTSPVGLGLTLAWAQCHDHKSSPPPQRDYYRLSAYFNSIDE